MNLKVLICKFESDVMAAQTGAYLDIARRNLNLAGAQLGLRSLRQCHRFRTLCSVVYKSNLQNIHVAC